MKKDKYRSDQYKEIENKFTFAIKEGLRAVQLKEHSLSQHYFTEAYEEFITLLHDANGMEGDVQALAYTQLEIAPWNLEERLLYVQKQQGKYTSFIQLQELFTELRKKIVAKHATVSRYS